MLEGRDLNKSFGRTRALRGAGVAVEDGEILAVMGPSGSGKSTLLHCLGGVLRPDSGQVRFGDAVVGAVAAGPWLCLVAARALIRHGRRATTLTAARRLAGDARGAFRAASGVVLAVFTAVFPAGLAKYGPCTSGPTAPSPPRSASGPEPRSCCRAPSSTAAATPCCRRPGSRTSRAPTPGWRPGSSCWSPAAA
ncbi:energy-coupling factor transporter ATP-binding protein EcfA2 [Nonomuraea thailandensis]|uniref:Energy-coupling factor transporter ATP-binding protein EcfA2 n=1 Tax=Nonomuraea thailandensis TaxID=1188745 RepID=A0A9X2GYU3_9ACTN|nr:ATP-binding cassette domain-containing protein [Nonomuraea thailandensis]MCP2363453.1 energy-coupling factor transporter ATP-binding protein EcfA2 [Nonomuraea thailandensis]